MSSSERIKELKIDSTLWTEVYEVRYDDGGLYLVIDDIKGYFNIDDNVGSILSIILTDDQKNKYHQVWKEILKMLMMEMEMEN